MLRAFLASRIAWCRWRRCWSWSRSSRPTWSRNNTPIARGAAPWTPFDSSNGWLRTGHTEVVDADLSGYFDSIPHAELLKSLARRISDGRMLRLIKMWLEAPVEETDEQGGSPSDDPEQGPGDGQPARLSDLPIVVEHLHAAICEGMEGGRA